MSIYSYTECKCVFPDTTALRKDPVAVWDGCVTHDGGSYVVEIEGETGYSDYLLDDFVEMFGKRLDRVQGLDLYVHYETDDDGHYECELTIVDGKCGFKESKVIMVDQPFEECPISIDGIMSPWERARSERWAKEAWAQLEDACVDHYGCIDTDWEVPALHRTYPMGTDREDIWHDIEDKFHISVAWLMGEAKNSDGTND